MNFKEYEDGSQMTPGLIVAATAAGTALTVAAYVVSEKLADWKTKRIMKKYGWPEEE